LEADLESRNATLEKIAKDRTLQKENTLTDLADLIGVSTNKSGSTGGGTMSGGGSLKGNNNNTNNNSNNNINSPTNNNNSEDPLVNSQMIAILTSQRDRYKEKLSLVRKRKNRKRLVSFLVFNCSYY
jgi:hypothetical protein